MDSNFLIFLGGVSVFMLFGYFFQKAQAKKMVALFKRLAEKHGGTVNSGGLLALPRWKVDVGGVEATISAMAGSSGGSSGASQPAHTYIHLPMALPETQTFSIRQRQTGDRLGKALGMQDIEVGNPAFDKPFVVKGKDEHFVRRVLNEKIQQQFVQLKKPCGLHLHPNQLVISINNMDCALEDMEWLLKTTLLLRAQLQNA